MTSPSSDLPPTDSGDPVLRAAIQWSIRLSESPDDSKLRAAFDRWLTETPEHAAAWAHTDDVFDLIGQAKSVAFLPTPEKRPAPARARPARAPARGWRTAAFAAVAAAVVVAVVAPQAILRWQADYVTGPARQQIVTLDDGSKVRLAPRSALRVDYAAGRRAVRLLAGEAYFEVLHDPARPFEVAAKAAKVTVLGTGFDVRLGDQGADVAVRHGRVRVDYSDGHPPVSSILTDGQWTRLAWNGTAAKGSTAPAIVGGWAADRIVAIDQPLSEVLADLRRYYGGAILLTDARLGRRIVTGSYEVQDPANALGVVVQPVGGKVTRVTPWLLIVSPS